MASYSSRQKASRSQDKKSFKIGNLALLTLYTILSSLLIFLMLAYNILAINGLNLIVITLLLIIFLVCLGLILTQRAQKTTLLLLLGAIVITGAGLFISKSVLDVTAKMNQTASYSEMEMSVVSLKKGDIRKLSDVKSLLAPVDNDSENVTALITALNDEKNVKPEVDPVDSYLSAYQALTSGKAPAIVMNSAYLSFIENEDPDYRSKIEVLYSYTIRKESEAAKPLKGDSFNIYISGIDTYGPISSVSRSDVNIIMTVNRKTNKILLTTTPRDAYVQIPDGGQNQYDKLTHAGIYGVEASIHALENLYGIDISYYARINFTSFTNLIDVLGGIEVQNDVAFSNGAGDFPVGKIALDSKKALAFVRERYSLANGDKDRGKNQEKVIAAIIDKLTSFKAISNYQSILSGIGTSIQTDMPTATLMDLANSQIASGGHFDVTSQAVDGTGSTGELPSFAMPNAKLYMLSLDAQSLENAKAAIVATQEGR